MRIIDISQPLGTGTAEWPGDRPFEVSWTLRRERGDSVNVAAVATSVHVGTHADGPLHTGDGPAVGSLPLEAFLGAAVVVDARPFVAGEPPLVSEAALEGLVAAETPRVLLRTRSDDAAGERFPDRFAALSPALCRRLAERRFRLVGTDAPSVDPVDSKGLESHRVLVEAGIPNLENLALSGVAPGRYTLVALPLRLTEADSSPVRAVLVGGRMVADGEE